MEVGRNNLPFPKGKVTNRYVTKLRQRLNKPTNWQEILKVMYTDVRTQVTGALTVEPSVVAGTRGTAYVYDDFTIANTTLTIDQVKNIPIFIDEADRFQQSYFGSPEIADFQGKKVQEFLETATLAKHASWVDFGQGDLDNTSADDTTQITVSATNIDDMIRAIRRKIFSNNGLDVARENGIFSIWRASDWEFLEAFMQSNGFNLADDALKNGAPLGVYYMGMYHYLSNDHTANHLFAGVRKVGKELGILRGTYGRPKFIEDPGLKSGLGIVQRLDFGFAFPSDATPSTQRVAEMNIDVNVV